MTQVSTKPASGTRDFLPAQAARRARVFSVIEEVYEAYGFAPLDTPSLERLTTLLGKYGEEGDKLLFKILKRGGKLSRALAEEDPGETDLADHGLRYDLTVPLARVVAEYQNELPRFFKRYQIGPVWRADRPQHGRFREFYQCDVDVVGSESMAVEVEVCAAAAEVLHRLGFDSFRIHVNHRVLLAALMERADIPAELHDEALIAIDKMDKIGKDGVIEELEDRGIEQNSIDELIPLLDVGEETKDSATAERNQQILTRLQEQLHDIETGAEAIDDLLRLAELSENTPASDHLVMDPYLARGLAYYTGPIFEIRGEGFPGSIGAGGRYDDLIGMFSKRDFPACGFSLGIERILVVMKHRGMFDEEPSRTDVLVTVWNGDFLSKSMDLARELRAAGLRVDLYPDDTDRYGKQFGYADDRDIPFVALLAPDEVEANTVTLKDMQSGDQHEIDRSEIVEWLEDRMT